MGIRGLLVLVLMAALVTACASTGQRHGTALAGEAVAMRAHPPAAARGRLIIHGTGDVNVDPEYIPALRTKGYAHAWTGLSGLFTRDHLSVVNLECPIS